MISNKHIIARLLTATKAGNLTLKEKEREKKEKERKKGHTKLL
jgi:hypothetical protein